MRTCRKCQKIPLPGRPPVFVWLRCDGCIGADLDEGVVPLSSQLCYPAIWDESNRPGPPVSESPDEKALRHAAFLGIA